MRKSLQLLIVTVLLMAVLVTLTFTGCIPEPKTYLEVTITGSCFNPFHQHELKVQLLDENKNSVRTINLDADTNRTVGYEIEDNIFYYEIVESWTKNCEFVSGDGKIVRGDTVRLTVKKT